MPRSLVLQGEIPEPKPRPKIALAAKGFRPFFVMAAAFAIAVVPLWLAMFDGRVRPPAYLVPSVWHAHEMLFGFVIAVMAGFLLTAVGNWTKKETLVGAPLLALSAVWALGRLAMAFAGSLPRGVPAVVDLAFLPLLVVALAVPLVATGNRRNFVMLAILAALFAVNVVMHFDALGVLPIGSARRAYLAGVDLVVLVVLIISGRVLPMFTRNATGVASIRSAPLLDVLAVLAMALLTGIDVVVPETPVAPAIAAIAGVLSVARAIHWGAQSSLRHPLLWILHAGYAWLALGFFLRVGAGFGSVPSSLGTHALTVGAIGSLTLGMMARVSLGHTGRPLVASRATVWAFAAMSVAAVLRVVVPIVAPGFYFTALVLAGTLWTSAFVVFLFVYTPMLVNPRPDGKPG